MDRQLVERARRGDHAAFEALAIGISSRLYAIARLILRDTHLAEDAVQEALVNIWRRLPQGLARWMFAVPRLTTISSNA